MVISLFICIFARKHQKVNKMRYKEVLKKYGVTQVELAKRLGIAHKETISKMLSPNYNMGADNLQKMAKAIGCQVGEFFDDWDGDNYLECPHCHKKFAFDLKAAIKNVSDE